MLAVINETEKPADAVLEIDLDLLNLTPRLVWQEFIRVRDFGSPAAGTATDFHKRTLTVKQVQPKSLRLVGVRRY